MDLNTLGAVQIKLVVKLRGQHIAYMDYTQAQTKTSEKIRQLGNIFFRVLTRNFFLLWQGLN